MLGSIFENVIDRRQDRGCDRADRFLWAAPALDAEKLRAVIAVFTLASASASKKADTVACS